MQPACVNGSISARDSMMMGVGLPEEGESSLALVVSCRPWPFPVAGGVLFGVVDD